MTSPQARSETGHRSVSPSTRLLREFDALVRHDAEAGAALRLACEAVSHTVPVSGCWLALRGPAGVWAAVGGSAPPADLAADLASGALTRCLARGLSTASDFDLDPGLDCEV